MGSTFKRSFVKGIIWEGVSFVIAFIIAYLYFGNFGNSMIFAIFLTIIKIPFYFLHERIWKMIRWGKIKDRR